jgi:uncharacterized protein with HEPN domain|tara:strand:- start:134 stop:505 length:372 start_codon:yes stop_codon:yes gene_type:complete
MKLNRQIVKDFRAILDDILNDNESLEQFIVKVGNASFDDTEVTFKVNLRLKGAETREQKDLRRYAEMDKVDTSKIAEVRGEKYSLIGYRRTAKTRPYIVQNLHNDKEYIFTTALAQQYFGVEV